MNNVKEMESTPEVGNVVCEFRMLRRNGKQKMGNEEGKRQNIDSCFQQSRVTEPGQHLDHSCLKLRNAAIWRALDEHPSNEPRHFKSPADVSGMSANHGESR